MAAPPEQPKTNRAAGSSHAPRAGEPRSHLGWLGCEAGGALASQGSLRPTAWQRRGRLTAAEHLLRATVFADSILPNPHTHLSRL